MNIADLVWSEYKRAIQAAKQWDQFPLGNWCEQLRPIERKSFNFVYHTAQIWIGGQCAKEEKGESTFEARVVANDLYVSITDSRLHPYTTAHFGFAEISENGDRMIWANNTERIAGLMSNMYDDGKAEPHVPSAMSMFFQQGLLAKIYIHIDEPHTLIELFGTEKLGDDASSADMDAESADNSKYDAILSYFSRNRFGAEMPVLTLLSTLPPQDRCVILSAILSKDPMNVEVYNKLSMAYLKNGQESKAHALLIEGRNAGALSGAVYAELEEKIRVLSETLPTLPARSSRSYVETLDLLCNRFASEANGPFQEFYGLLVRLCEDR